MQTTLYVYRDLSGVVLYVGITDRGMARSIEHFVNSEWWFQAASATLTHYASRDEALAAEKGMIQEYRPIFNVQHNLDHAELRKAYADNKFSIGGNCFYSFLNNNVAIFQIPKEDWETRLALKKLAKDPARLKVGESKAKTIDLSESAISVAVWEPTREADVVLWHPVNERWRVDYC